MCYSQYFYHNTSLYEAYWDSLHFQLFYRLCNDPHLAEEVVRLQGLKRLVELCKCESARVASDGVLVACLAAVRKVIIYFQVNS